jgi:hypothetical protein
VVEGRRKLAEQLTLLVSYLARGYDPQAHLQVATAAIVEVRHTLATNSEHPAALGTGRDLEAGCLLIRIKHRYVDLVAERGLGEIDRQVELQIIALATEEAVRLDVNDQVEVAGWATVGAGLTFVTEANLRVVVDTGRDADLQLALNLDAALTAALLARVLDDRAVTVAAIADADIDELAKQILVNPPQFAAAATTDAGDRGAAGLDAAAAAGGSGVVAREGDLALGAEDRVVEANLEVDPQVGAPLHALAPAGRGGRAEERVKDVLDAEPARSPEGAAAEAAVLANVAEAIVGCPTLPIGEDLIGLLDLFEPLRGASLGVAIRVVLQHQLAVRFAHVVLAGAAAHAEYFIVVAFGCRHLVRS